MTSSNTITDLMPRIVARGLLRFREQAILPRLVSSSLSAEAARRGESIRVPISQPVAARDVTPGVAASQAPASAMQSVNVPLDNWKSAGFFLTDAEMMQIEAESSFIPLQMAEAITALANAVNESILVEVEKTGTVIGTAGEVPFQTVESPSEIWHGANAAIAARKLLNLAAAPKAGRFAVIDYEMEANALGLPQFHDAQRAGSASVPMEGEIGRKFGIDWFSNDLLPRNRASIARTRFAARIEADASGGDLQIAATKVKIGDVIIVGSGRTSSTHQVTTSRPANSGKHAAITVTPVFSQAIEPITPPPHTTPDNPQETQMPAPLAGLAGGLALVDQLVRLFTPINRLVDEFHDSEEDRAKRRAEVTALQNEALALALALERERLVAQAAIVSAEAGGASWLQRNWRPITMLSFLGLVIADAFGMLAFRLADQAWLLLQIGLGGYVVGRSVEKISPQIANGGPHVSRDADAASPAKSSSRPSAKSGRRAGVGAGVGAGAGSPKSRVARDAGPR
ncbi:3TM-type holin [Alphaproteobacteria bacterium LSUCC0719]